MDRFGHSATSLDELRQIQSEARASQSLAELRSQFERIQELRRIHSGNFDVQLIAAEAQEEIIERARDFRSRSSSGLSDEEVFTKTGLSPRAAQIVTEQARPEEDLAEHAGEQLNSRSWRRATYLALGLTAAICVIFFYLIQTARRINLSPPPAPVNTNTPAATNKVPVANTKATEPAVSLAPTVRLYTDLIPGTVSVDDGEPQDLKDGELILDHLEPGRHSIKVAGRSGSAAFSFNVSENTAPQVVVPLTAINALAVLVSAQDGKGRLFSNAPQPEISVDGKSLGQASPDGLALENLTNTDHELQVMQANDRQRFVMTYTPAPVLTVYIKSDPNAGTVTITTRQDDVSIYIGDKLYRRKTDRGQIRLPLKVGKYAIHVHKDGFVDPAPQMVEVIKGQEAELSFDLEPAPSLASLQIQGAAPGTTVLIDKSQVGIAGADGDVSVASVKEGAHTVELRLDGLTPKRFRRDFAAGTVVSLSGPDTTLEKPKAEPLGTERQPVAKTAEEAKTPSAPAPADVPGEQIRKGGGFVHYNSPKSSGHVSFRAHSKIGGFLKHDKLQWYAGYQNSENYVLFTLDGKHATVRKMREGRSIEITRIPFSANSDEWVQVDMSVLPDSINTRIRGPGGSWNELAIVGSDGRDFTQDKVGFYVPGNDEVAVANFHFARQP